jgi:putative tryptophan/tyrosine transport system substrate-binding protein
MTLGSERLAGSSKRRGTRLLKMSVAGLTLCAMLLALCSFAQARQAESLARIGTLGAAGGSGNPSRRWDAFRQGLRELGYAEGKNIVIESRAAGGQTKRLAELATELVRLKVAVIVTGGASATQGAKITTSTVPIVMAQDNDPVGSKFVASLARPGGNITGLANQSSEMNGKRLELLKEIVPRLSRVTVFGNSTNPGNSLALQDIQNAAGALGLQLQYRDIQDSNGIEPTFRAASRGVDAVLWLNNPVLLLHRAKIADLVAKSRIPAIYDEREFSEAGGLMSYGRDVLDLFKRAAIYVDKILKGAQPANLPVEQPTKFELVINLKAAKQIGLTIPPNALARADRVIR